MSVIDTLIRDRTQYDVNRVYELKRKIMLNGYSSLTQAEKAEYDGGMKGAYNTGDLNRVGNAQLYLKDLFDALPAELQTYLSEARTDVYESLRYPEEYYTLPSPILPDSLQSVSYSYPVAIATPKVDWLVDQYPGEVRNAGYQTYAIAYYLDNINILRNILPSGSYNLPPTPSSLNNLDYIKANNIEEILWQVHQIYSDYEASKLGDIDDAKDEAIHTYQMTDASWVWSGEAYSGEF